MAAKRATSKIESDQYIDEQHICHGSLIGNRSTVPRNVINPQCSRSLKTSYIVTRMRTAGVPNKHERGGEEGGEGEDNKKLRLLLRSPSSRLGLSNTYLRRTSRLNWDKVISKHIKENGWSLTSPLTAYSLGALILRSLGATSQTRWRTRPCHNAARSAQKFGPLL